MARVSSEMTDLALPRQLSATAVAAWLIAALVAGRAGVFDRPGRPPFELLGFVVLPMVGFGTAYFGSRTFRAFAASVKLTWLVGSHLWRLVGLGFIIGWYRGALPAGFAIPEGLGDIIAALGAMALVRSLAAGATPRRWLLAWNVFGLVDLVTAISLGVLYSNGPLGLLSGGSVTTRPMVTFPVSLIPSFFVPLFILLHVLTFTRLAAGSALTSRPPCVVNSETLDPA